MKALPLLLFCTPLICVVKARFIFVPVIIADTEVGFVIATFINYYAHHYGYTFVRLERFIIIYHLLVSLPSSFKSLHCYYYGCCSDVALEPKFSEIFCLVASECEG